MTAANGEQHVRRGRRVDNLFYPADALAGVNNILANFVHTKAPFVPFALHLSTKGEMLFNFY